MSDARDLTPPEAKPLTPANQNPWYVLMTLYGEQEGELVNQELHEKNRAAWNAWACQRMSEEGRANAAKSSCVSVKELGAWYRRADEIAALHREAWQARNPGGPEWPGLPNAEKLVELEQCLFSHSFVATGFVFDLPVSFRAAKFGKDAWFDSTTFKNSAGFASTHFQETLWFVCSYFISEVSFENAVFQNDARFCKSDFSSVATFESARFHEYGDFVAARFHGYAGFRSTTFSKQSFWDRSSFDEIVYFSHASFGAEDNDARQLFTDCNFKKSVNFRGACFYNSFPKFEGTALHPETTFTAKDFNESRRQHWPQSPCDLLAAKASCSKIRNCVGKQGFPEDEHFFYRREMRFAGLAATNPFEKLAYGLFGLLSDYGYSFVRPLAALALVFSIGFLAHWGYFLGGAARAETGWTAFGISFANMFPYFGIGRYFDPKALQMLPTALKAIGAMQTVLGAVLLFLLALGLRTRFRMR